jgi:hypothetical protein
MEMNKDRARRDKLRKKEIKRVKDVLTRPNSDCCNSPVIVMGHTTHWYMCSKCEKPCGEKRED